VEKIRHQRRSFAYQPPPSAAVEQEQLQPKKKVMRKGKEQNLLQYMDGNPYGNCLQSSITEAEPKIEYLLDKQTLNRALKQNEPQSEPSRRGRKKKISEPSSV